MRFDFISQPLSEDDPCGPDLDLEMDNDYGNYTLLASGRLPSRYFDSEGNPFDRSTIDLAGEVRAISELLERTRDARLISLDIRFHALRGEIVGFSEGVQGLALLVSKFWDTFHPRPEDGDYIFRVNAVEAIDDQVQVVLPLQFAPLVKGGRSGAVTLRNFLVATGKSEARGNEEPVSVDTVRQALTEERQAEQVAETYKAIKDAIEALGQIRATFFANNAEAPSFERVVAVLNEMASLIATYRTDLGGQAVAEDGEVVEDEAADTGGGSTSRRSALPAGLIKTHASAAAALRAVELYFFRCEPSSPSLALVHHARSLAGKPMSDVFENLIPNQAEEAVMKFDGGFSFTLNFFQLKNILTDAMAEPPTDEELAEAEEAEAAELAAAKKPVPVPMLAPPPASETSSASDDEAGSGDGEFETSDGVSESEEGGDEEQSTEVATYEEVAEEEPPTPPAAPKFLVLTRADAGDMMTAIEAFYKHAEPSSPVPVLLAKARNYLNKDFLSLLNEMVPKPT